MKTIQIPGTDSAGSLRIAYVPDNATSANDPRAVVITAPAGLRPEYQYTWLCGYAAAVQELCGRSSN